MWLRCCCCCCQRCSVAVAVGEPLSLSLARCCALVCVCVCTGVCVWESAIIIAFYGFISFVTDIARERKRERESSAAQSTAQQNSSNCRCCLYTGNTHRHTRIQTGSSLSCAFRPVCACTCITLVRSSAGSRGRAAAAQAGSDAEFRYASNIEYCTKDLGNELWFETWIKMEVNK